MRRGVFCPFVCVWLCVRRPCVVSVAVFVCPDTGAIDSRQRGGERKGDRESIAMASIGVDTMQFLPSAMNVKVIKNSNKRG